MRSKEDGTRRLSGLIDTRKRWLFQMGGAQGWNECPTLVSRTVIFTVPVAERQEKMLCGQSSTSFEDVVSSDEAALHAMASSEAMAEIDQQLEAELLHGFERLGRSHARLAIVVERVTGDRRRAACWMACAQTSLRGQTAYHALACGDIDLVWEAVGAMDL
jgi:hypothetical protein